MTFQLGVDVSWTMPDPATVKAAGYGFMIGYLSADPAKDLSASRVSEILAAGLVLGAVFETTAQRALDGEAAGAADGASAVSQLRALGAPAGTPVLVNVGDFAVDPSQVATVAAYYEAWRGALAEYVPGAGGYGTEYIIDQLVAGGAIGIWWQNAIDDAGESGSAVSPNASLYQRVRPVGTVNGQPVADPSKLPAGSFDEDVAGFGPVPVPAWWAPAPPSPPEVTVTALPDGAVQVQPGFSFCTKCSGLYFRSAGRNVCPAGGAHAGSPADGSSFDYSLLHA